jgi:hypothetical protein
MASVAANRFVAPASRTEEIPEDVMDLKRVMTGQMAGNRDDGFGNSSSDQQVIIAGEGIRLETRFYRQIPDDDSADAKVTANFVVIDWCAKFVSVLERPSVRITEQSDQEAYLFLVWIRICIG